MEEARQTKNPALVHTSRVCSEVGDQFFLDCSESFRHRLFHQPVAMQGFSGFDNQRRFKRKCLYLGKLLLQRQVITLHKLCIDACDLIILVTAEVDDKIDAAPLLIVLLQGFGNTVESSGFHLQLLPGECAVRFIAENTEAHGLRWFKKCAQKLRRGDGQTIQIVIRQVHSPPVHEVRRSEVLRRLLQLSARKTPQKAAFPCSF